MRDYDADEIVRQRRRRERTPLIDRALTATGVVLAGLATFFPWYAFMHQDQFSMPALWEGKTRNVPGFVDEGSASLPLATAERQAATQAAIDWLTTATVPNSEQQNTLGAPGDLEQPFPAAITSFKLMHVANGRALIEDQSGMYIVGVGSTLPDNSRLATLEQRDGRWVMITSKGEIYQAD
ncbi:flagellar protein [Pararhizobium sp. BT-229]|uniref:flagellar protein n=1 Tax=Pararhizobium sp. BT-229 TaxID=2986923 RepID=UPI0021F7D816|nr:flagellar protein [Pararhizobium sp. BT-229]MCV9962821.1 flagellar protein [Pararhizobium sp. BT-229]